MPIRTTEAVILKTQPLRNTSLIITAFTKDFGKIQGVAKGIRQRLSRKDCRHFCYLEYLTLAKIVYYEKARSGLHLITQSDLIDQFENIRQDLPMLAAAGFVLELADKGTALEDKNKDLFSLLVKTLEGFSAGKDIQEGLLSFKMDFLNLSGLLHSRYRALGQAPQGRCHKEKELTNFIKEYINSEFKSLAFMEKIKVRLL